MRTRMLLGIGLFRSLHVVLLLALVQCEVAISQHPICPIETNIFDAGASPAFMAIDDFDLDGDQDIVVNGSSSALDGGGLSLLLNRGDGAFVERVEIAPFSGPFEVDSADINGDGIPDLVSQTANSIEVYFNNGLADFALQQSIPATTGGCEIVDLNGDAAVDLVIAMPSGIDVYINSGGVFNFIQTESHSCRIEDFEAVDLDMDGNQDLIGSCDEGIFRMLSDGAGGLEIAEVINLFGRLASGDIDGDGDVDVCVFDSIETVFLVNDGFGNFSLGEVFLGGDFTGRLIDTDSDGDLDLVTSNTLFPMNSFLNGLISLRRNNGKGQFGDAEFVANPAIASDLQFGEFDDDEGLDFIWCDLSRDTIQLISDFEDQHDRWIPHFSIFEGNTFFLSSKFFVADFNLDGLDDVIVSNDSSDEIGLFLNEGGAFSAAVFDSPFDSQLIVGDVNGDKLPDVCVGTEFQTPRVGIFLNKDGNCFEDILEINVNGRLRGTASFDGDSFAELLIESENVVTVYQTVDGVSYHEAMVFDFSEFPALQLIPADFDGDGNTDLLVASSGFDEVNAYSLFTNDGDGNLTQGETISLKEQFGRLRLADLDGDGDNDLVSTIFSRLFTFHNSGEGQFRIATLDLVVPPGTEPLLMDVADINSDGYSDLLILNAPGSFIEAQWSIYVLENIGNGTFRPGAPVSQILPSFRPKRFINFDGDQTLEVLTERFSSDRVGFLTVFDLSCTELGDTNGDGVTNLSDVRGFVSLLTQGGYQIEADVNFDGSVDLLDVLLFVELLVP